jgi:hypothetical protein
MAKRIPRGVVPKPKSYGYGTAPPHDRDVVEIVLPS